MSRIRHAGSFVDRRRCLLAGCAALLPSPVLAHPRDAAGEVTPARLAPALLVTTQDGRQQPLLSLLEGKRTALQLMFTGCSSVCPIQGALFTTVQSAIAHAALRDAHLLSLSIDPLADSPAELQKWRSKFSAGKRWLAAVPADRDLTLLLAWLGGSPTGLPDRHTTQVYVVDGAGRLGWRSTELPTAGEVVSLLRAVQARPVGPFTAP